MLDGDVVEFSRETMSLKWIAFGSLLHNILPQREHTKIECHDQGQDDCRLDQRNQPETVHITRPETQTGATGKPDASMVYGEARAELAAIHFFTIRFEYESCPRH